MKSCGYLGGRGSLQNHTIFFGGGGGFLNILGLFKVKIRMGFFFGQQNFKYFWVCLIFLISFFFWGGGGGGGDGGLNSRCWV